MPIKIRKEISKGVGVIRIVGCLAWLLVLVIGLLWPDGVLAFFVAIATLLYIGSLVSRRNTIHMMFFLGFCTFIFLPAVLHWYYRGLSFEFYYITSFVSVFFIFATRKLLVNEFADYGFPTRLLFYFFCFLMLGMIFAGMGELSSKFFAFLIVLMSLSYVNNNVKNNLFVFFCFFGVFICYVIFYWSGYGRTVTVGWILLAALQLAYSLNIPINKYFFALVPGGLAPLLVNRDFLNLEFRGFEGSLSGSAYQPYALASTFIDRFHERGYDVSGFIDQLLFTFFVYIPRDIWVEKPNGFGFEYTVRHLDSYLVNAGHSIASTFVGDHLYYLGYIGVLTSVIVMAVFAFVANILYRIKGLNGNGVLLFSASMMVLAWGGMTSFSARVAAPSIVFVVMLVVFKPLLNNKVKFVWGK